MRENNWRNYTKVFVIYFIILIIHNILFKSVKMSIEMKMNNNLLSQCYLAIGRLLLGLLIWFLPDKLNVKIHFIFKIVVYVITMIAALLFLDMLGSLN
ncbi:hypothetical protein CN579_27105 [Bacillus toyonensis]|nr:hypothetical protein CN579_27105 [Bacillus toyonensis]